MFKNFTLLTIVFLFCSTVAAEAIDFTQLKTDLESIPATIIMPIGDEYLIEKDALSGINEGDIVTAVMASEKIVHPETKKTLGEVEQPIGFLEVTRVKSGYSYIKPLSDKLSLKKGNKVIRYEKVPAVLITSPENQQQSNQVKAALNNFHWLDPHDSNQAFIIFNINNDRLKITNRQDILLYEYKLDEENIIALTKPLPPVTPTYTDKSSSGFLQAAMDKVIDTISPDRMKLMDPKSGAIRPGQKTIKGGWSSPVIKGNPRGVAVADFDRDGNNEIALALNNRLIVSRIMDDEYRKIAEVKLPKGLNILSLDAIDADNDGAAELYLTAESSQILKSLSIKHEAGTYVITQKNLPWYLRVVTQPGIGPILLGQKRGSAGKDYVGPIFRMAIKDGNLSAQEEFHVPDGINLFSFTPFIAEDNGAIFYAYLNAADKLTIASPEGLELWQSSEAFGGSEIKIYDDTNTVSASFDPTFIPPRIMTNKSGAIIVVQNFGLRFLSDSRFFDSSRVAAFRWDGVSLQEQWSTLKSNGYTSDYTIADMNNDGEDEIVMAVQTKHGNILQNAESEIVSQKLGK